MGGKGGKGGGGGGGRNEMRWKGKGSEGEGVWSHARCVWKIQRVWRRSRSHASLSETPMFDAGPTRQAQTPHSRKTATERAGEWLATSATSFLVSSRRWLTRAPRFPRFPRRAVRNRGFNALRGDPGSSSCPKAPRGRVRGRVLSLSLSLSQTSSRSSSRRRQPTRTWQPLRSAARQTTTTTAWTASRTSGA